MTDHTSHIKNPLTVISRFAAVAEICGSVVLPFIAGENQLIYIWFLILFPTLIVLLFFATLNFNHKKLYAPSDYKNENHFIDLFGTVTREERNEKLEDEVAESIPESVSDASSASGSDGYAPIPDAEPRDSDDEATQYSKVDEVSSKITDTSSPNPGIPQQQGGTIGPRDKKPDTAEKFDFEAFAKESKIEMMLKIKKLEGLAIHKLSSETHITFQPEIKFDIPNIKDPLIFDAIATTADTVHITEVKYFKDSYAPHRFTDTIRKAAIAARNISSVSDKKVCLHLIVVLEESGQKINTADIKADIREMTKRSIFDTKTYVTTPSELAKLSQPLDTWFFTR